MGTIALNSAGRAQLQGEMLETLLRAMLGKEDIFFSGGSLKWQLANHGANMVLKRMDVFQGRDSSPTALVNKGQSREPSQVIPEDSQEHAELYGLMRRTLRQHYPDSFCETFRKYDPEMPPSSFEDFLTGKRTMTARGSMP